MSTNFTSAGVGNMAADAQKSVDDFVDDTRRRAESSARQAGSAAQDIYDDAKHKVQDAAVAVGGSVQAQPIAALLLAGVVGGLLGALLLRR